MRNRRSLLKNERHAHEDAVKDEFTEHRTIPDCESGALTAFRAELTDL